MKLSSVKDWYCGWVGKVFGDGFTHGNFRMSQMTQATKADPLKQPSEQVHFVCNLCGADNSGALDTFDREGGGCKKCNSTVRLRSMADVLAQHLWGSSKTLCHQPPNKQLVGVGMSDDGRLANVMEEKFSYTNTFFHCEPFLDIANMDDAYEQSCDFVISSDVFEHVPPPVQRAFDNLYRMLKPGGVAVFSVPFSLEDDTVEHFPDLHDFEVKKRRNGDWYLENTTKDGRFQVFENLVFHGGPGSTLEMRLFSLAALKRHFLAAGFDDVQVHDAPVLEHGIYWRHPWSITVSATRKSQSI